MAIDMPMQELNAYLGTNPRPSDFADYWNRGRTAMARNLNNYTMLPADFQTPFAHCYDLYFQGVGGARVYAKVLIPKHIPDKAPALLMFHGYYANSGDWSDKLSYAAAGFVVAAMDCRGQAGRSENIGCPTGSGLHGMFAQGLDKHPDELIMRNVFLDTAQLAGIIMDLPQVDETRVCAMGGSQGGALTVACAALEPRIRCIGVMYPFLSDYQRVWQMNLAANAYDELTKYFRVYDPLHEHREEIFTKLGYIDVHNLAPWVKAKTLMAVSMMDNICPPSTQFAVYNNLQCEKNLLIYHDYGHELYLPGCSDRFYQFFLQEVGHGSETD